MRNPPVPGFVVATRGVLSLPSETQVSIWEMVRRFDKFTEDNDPHGEHDFGSFGMSTASAKTFSGRSIITRMRTARSARKTPPTRPNRPASSPSSRRRSIEP
jgi:hypothetical protein